MSRNLQMNGYLQALQDGLLGLKNFYLNLRIKNKLFLIYFMIVFIVGLMSITAIQVTFTIYEGILGDEFAKVLNLSTVSIENELKQVERFSANIIANPELQKSLLKLTTGLSYSERSLEADKVTDDLWAITFEHNIVSVNVIDAGGKQYAGGMVIPQKIVQSVLKEAAAKEGAMVFSGPYTGGRLLICARQIREIGNPRNPSLRPIGTLIILVNMAGFVSQSTAQPIDQDVNLLICSGSRIIYASNSFLRGMAGRLHFSNGNGYQVLRNRGRNYFIAQTRSTFTNWDYISGIPYDVIFKQIRMIRQIVYGIFILLILFTVLLSLKSARNLTRPLEELAVKMRRVAMGELEITQASGWDSLRTDEIGELQSDFHIMVQKIDILIKENYTKQLMIKDAQLKALQAQINPHFLYNTLDSINWLAKANKQKEISLMAEALGNLLRKTIEHSEQVITIQEEIQLVQDYITIQKSRFCDRLDFHLSIPEEWRDFLIPKMSLQPIVENSINYALEKMTGICKIAVRAVVLEGRFYIEISDNGPGMDAKIINGLHAGTIESKGTGIGLNNINNRIKLIFGNDYQIDIQSEPGKGTKVWLPVLQREENNV
jgi:two-component system, sensor histidine kinase YesM